MLTSYKYLGTVIDDRLKWTDNTINVCKKANKRMYFLRTLKKCQVDKIILRLFYDSVISSVLQFCMIAWFNSLTNELSLDITRIEKTSKRLIKDDYERTLISIYDKKMLCMINRIADNPNHPLKSEFCVLKSGVRLRTAKVRTNR